MAKERFRLDIRGADEDGLREVYLMDRTMTDGRFLLCDQRCSEVDLLKIKTLVRLANKQLKESK